MILCFYFLVRCENFDDKKEKLKKKEEKEKRKERRRINSPRKVKLFRSKDQGLSLEEKERKEDKYVGV